MCWNFPFPLGDWGRCDPLRWRTWVGFCCSDPDPHEIEDHFHVRFEDEEIGTELFQSVNTLAQSVEQHLGPRVDGRGR